MATNLVTPLPVAAFSKNRVFAVFQTDSVFASVGQTAVTEFELQGTIFFNRSITLKYGSVSVDFRTMNPLLPITGANLPTGFGDLAHAQAMLPYFQANFYLNRDFIISVPNDSTRPRVVFTAKKVGAPYNIVPAVLTNILIINVTIGAEALRKKNMALALECEIYDSAADVWSKVYSERIPYRSTQLKINIAEILDGELMPDFPAQWSGIVPWKHTKSLRKYRLSAAEGYGDSFALQPAETFPECFVQFGGTGFVRGLSLTPALWVQGATAADDKFLQNGEFMRTLQLDEPAWLSFLNTRADIASLVIQIRIEYADDSIVTITKTPGIALAANECVSIPVWVTALELQLVDDTKAIRSYYVRLKSGSNFVSREVRYVLDYAYREHKQYFVFLNSVGGWDSFMAYGKSAYGASWTNTQIERPIPENYSLMQGDLSDVGSEMRDIFTVSTGQLTMAQIRWMRDFFGSPCKFRYVGGRCLPISTKAKDLPEGADGQNQYTHDFEYSYAFADKSFA